jgi:glucose-6-phosphate dehydrogenase assembly protein OpcA
MAPAVSRREWRESTPAAIEADLAALWRELAHDGKIARAVMTNLVVFRLRERASEGRANGAPRDSRTDAAPETGDPLDAVLARHPSRAIIIEHVPGHSTAGGPVGAGVGVLICGPPAARYGVETVLVQSACAEASLPSVVRRFVRGDLPTSIWWTEDLSTVPPLAPLLKMGRQLIYDSRRWRQLQSGIRIVANLAADRLVDLADLNWRRLAPLREALVHAAGFADTRTVTADLVRIEHRPDEEPLAWLLAGWLAAKLEWPATAAPTLRAVEGTDEILTVTIGKQAPAMLEGCLNAQRACVTVTGRPRIVLPTIRESEADAVAAELRILACETELHETIAALAQRFAPG